MQLRSLLVATCAVSLAGAILTEVHDLAVRHGTRVHSASADTFIFIVPVGARPSDLAAALETDERVDSVEVFSSDCH